jgi:hypothetical protein
MSAAVDGTACARSAYSNFHSLANVSYLIDAECSVLGTHESV